MGTTDTTPPGVPPEIWADFSKQLDRYIENWTKEVRDHITQQREKFAETHHWPEQEREHGRFVEEGGGGSGAEGEKAKGEVDVSKMGPFQPPIDHGQPATHGTHTDEMIAKIQERLGHEEKRPLNPEALPHAQALYDRAKREEGAITHEIIGSATAHGGEMGRMVVDGKPTQVKELESLQRKIGDEAAKTGQPFSEIASKIKDSVRYTVVFPPDVLAFGAHHVIEDLRAKGWEPLTPKNFFGDTNCYNGVNSFFKRADGLMMEVQFHTPASLAHAEKVHTLYNIQRRLNENSKDYRYVTSVMLRMTMEANLTPPNWERAPGEPQHSKHPKSVLRYVSRYARLAASAEDPGEPSCRFYTYDAMDGSHHGLFRWWTSDDDVGFDAWDLKEKRWGNWPPFTAIMGIGGVTSYVEIDADEAQKIAGAGAKLYPPTQGQLFYSEDQPRIPAGEEGAGEFTHGGGGGGSSSKEEPVDRHASKEEGSPRAIDHVGDMRAAVPGTPSHAIGTEVPPHGTIQYLRYQYAARLDRIEEETAMSPGAAKMLDDLVKQYGGDKVAMAVASSKWTTGYAVRDIGNALRTVTGPSKEMLLGAFREPLLPGATLDLNNARLAFALEHGWNAEDMIRNWNAAQAYSGNDYKGINGVMRGLASYSPEANDMLVNLGRQFDSVLKQAPEIERGAAIARAVRVKEGSAMARLLRTPGAEYEEKGFLSASTSRLFCENWARAKIEPGKDVFVLGWEHEGGARNIMPFLTLGTQEGEIHYRPGARMRVESVRRGRGITYVTVRVRA